MGKESGIVRVGRAALAAGMIWTAAGGVANAQTTEKPGLAASCQSGEMARIPPEDPKWETASVYDKKLRERMRIVYPQGSQNQKVGKGYFVPDPNDLKTALVSYGSYHPQQDDERPVESEKGLVVDVTLTKEEGSDFYKFYVNIRDNGEIKGLFGSQVMLDPCRPGYFNFNWDNYKIFGFQHNGQDVKQPFFSTQFENS